MLGLGRSRICQHMYDYSISQQSVRCCSLYSVCTQSFIHQMICDSIVTLSSSDIFNIFSFHFYGFKLLVMPSWKLQRSKTFLNLLMSTNWKPVNGAFLTETSFKVAVFHVQELLNWNIFPNMFSFFSLQIACNNA